ncbi:hypothetical protein E5288_WYG005728 [Bos mutus]|uniref:Uncharacterized protein n=1 Tax=Bos mutus TaxID=72004 RepID=A0A6B0RR83_9CETA|nr:hypothetical protein [Bos mutus]
MGRLTWSGVLGTVIGMRASKLTQVPLGILSARKPPSPVCFVPQCNAGALAFFLGLRNGRNSVNSEKLQPGDPEARSRIYGNFYRKPLDVPQSVYDAMQTFLEFLLLVPKIPETHPVPQPHTRWLISDLPSPLPKPPSTPASPGALVHSALRSSCPTGSY